MNTIYLWCEALGTGDGIVQGSTVGGDVMGYAAMEDGRIIASHLSSSEGFSRYDMGLTSDRKHETYNKECPEGYTLTWGKPPIL